MFDDVEVRKGSEEISLHIEHTIHCGHVWYGEAEYGGYHFKLTCFSFACRSWEFVACLEHPYTSIAKILTRIAKKQKQTHQKVA